MENRTTSFTTHRTRRARSLALVLALTLMSAEMAALDCQGTIIPVAKGASSTAPAVSQPALLAGGIGNQVAPALAGNILAYEDCPLPSIACALRLLNLTTRESYALSAIIAQPSFLPESHLANNGTLVAWADSKQVPSGAGNSQETNVLDNTDIYAANLTDNTPFPVTTAPNRQDEPAVGGNLVVWTDYRAATRAGDTGAARIYMYDLTTHRETAVSPGSGTQTHPATNGNVVVWEDGRRGQDLPDVYGFDISTGQEFLIAKMATEPAISGDIVVWAQPGGMGASTGIFGYDLKAKRQLTINTTPSGHPAISGNAVVWADYRNATQEIGPQPVDIFGYDLASRKPFAVMVGGEKAHTAPAVGGSRIAWVDEGLVGGEAGIMGATLTGVATTPTTSPPPAAGSRTFEQTGKTVSGRFLDYWQKNGGLAQQGYPISEVLHETSELDGKTYQVQYFERAVFELHPENQHPYDVLLSQLGTFRLKQKYPGQAKLPGDYQAGTISGSISYPSEGVPALEVYAIPTSGALSKYRSAGTWANNGNFSLEGLEPGTYYVVAYTSVQDMQQVLAYTKADACRAVNPDPEKQNRCADLAPASVTVAAGGSVEKVNFGDLVDPGSVPPRPAQGVVQGTCRSFKETGKVLCGAFLEYWMLHGGLSQQGFPISNAFTETSELDGKSYQVQYFERAVFELHPENKPPYDVLLSQLGTFRLKQKYPGK